jgi:DNA-binding NarL/FixJ family response regulator
VSPTPVLLADLPPLLEEMIASFLHDDGNFHVVRVKLGTQQLFEAAAKASASVIVVARSKPTDLSAIDARVAKALRTSVVALSTDGTSAVVHTFHTTKQLIEDVSTQQIISALIKANIPSAKMQHETSHRH